MALRTRAQHPHELHVRGSSLDASFSSLLDQVRRDLVVGYLANPRFEVGHVASLLGFMQHASFTRWFSHEFGETPTGWRRRGDNDASRSVARTSRPERPRPG